MPDLLCNPCETILNEKKTLEVVKEFLDRDDSSHIREKQVIKDAAIACLHLFTRYNWLCSDCDHVIVNNDLMDFLTRHFSDIISTLAPNEKHIPGLCRLKCPSLLCFAVHCLPVFECQNFSDSFWSLRILSLKQLIIHEPNSSIFEEICSRRQTLLDQLNNLENVDDRLMVNLNLCNIFLWYRQIQPAKSHLDAALHECDLTIDLEGKLGKKTKFQVTSKPLLRLNLSRKTRKENVDDPIEKDNNLPKNVSLNDDTVLGQTVWDDKNLPSIALKPIEEVIICTIMNFMIASSSSDDVINQEEISSYLEHIIRVGQTWSVIYKCLFLRSLHELNSMRKVERSLMQLEELINEPKNVEKISCKPREKLFYPVVVDPVWLVEKTLADILFNNGCTKSSLEIYQRLQLWEPMVLCYCRLDRRDKAEALVREQLTFGETPYLLCLLGDVTGDPSRYEKALKISDNRSSRAYRSLGDYHFNRKEYSECLLYYKKSLDINSMQPTSWARLAYAALSTENFAQCAQAYRRALQFDEDNFEAWNNLSKAYIKLGDKKRAYKTLQESLKYNFDNWRIWENFLHVSLDVGELESVINAWHRLIDIKGKHGDDEIIELVVDAVIALGKEPSETGSKPHYDRLIKKLSELLGRISATSPVNSVFWLSYANLLVSQEDKVRENLDRILNFYSKSYQCLSRRANWESDQKMTLETLKNSSLIAKNLTLLHNGYGEPVVSTMYSFKLWINSALNIVANNQNRWENDMEVLKTVTEASKNLKERYDELIKTLN